MLILPAMDLIGGECVRLIQGDYNRSKVYSKKPVFVARSFEKLGAGFLHVVDLEGAKKGEMVNFSTIKKIVENSSLSIQVGGGVRSEKDITALLKLGVDRVILSTAAVKDREMLMKVLKKFGPEKIIVSIDARDENVLISGWFEESCKTLMEFVDELKKIGITNVIFTDIKSDGMLKGPNFESISRVVDSGLNVIVAGGVSSFQDLEMLKKRRVYGVIIGKALYEGLLDLKEVMIFQQNTLAKRVIPCMDVQNGRVVKGVCFSDLKDVGDPVSLAKKYSDMGADELVFLDITATIEGRKTLCELVLKIAENINIPFTVGGGIGDIEDIRNLLNNGADKVSIGSAAVKNPLLIKMAAEKFGSQCVVVSVDAKKLGKSWEIFIDGGKVRTGIDAVEFSREMERLGAGELLVNSLDCDGVCQGYDLELLRTISDAVNIPVIASSGAGKKEDFLEVLKRARVDAVLAASVFHSGQIEIPVLKKYLNSKNITIRL